MGTSTPNTTTNSDDNALEIWSEAGTDSDIHQRVAGSGTGVHLFSKSKGTLAAPTTAEDDNNIGKIRGQYHNGSDFYQSTRIIFEVDGTPASDAPSKMKFYTTAVGSTTPSVRMTIKNNGNVGIGTTSPSELLDVNGKTKTTTFQMTTSPTNGYVLQTDASGNGSWVNPTTLSTSNWTTSGTNQYSALSGNIGIGTTTPTQAKLVVNGFASNSLSTYGYLNSLGQIGTSSTSNSYAIYASNYIAAGGYHAFSDRRIKKILRGSNSAEDLANLMQIKITDYQLIDSISKGNKIIKKVIAQEVAEVLPNAVNKMTDFIPNIYKLAKIENGFIALINHGLVVGDKVKLIFGDKQDVYKVLKINEKGFYTERVSDGSVFVYGKEVNDFHTVDYEALSTLNISATQELVKQLNDLKAQNEILKKTVQTQNDTFKSDIENIKAELSKLTLPRQ